METIKEEKKADLEQLLNSLIEKGWKRKGKEKIEKATIRLSESWQVYFGTEEHPYLYADTLRGITSKNSGLWQFVCENGMYKTDYGVIIYNGERAKDVFYKVSEFDEEGDVIQTGDMEGEKFIGIYEPEYRLIESSLRDESELEDFLLSNVKVDEKD